MRLLLVIGGFACMVFGFYMEQGLGLRHGESLIMAAGMFGCWIAAFFVRDKAPEVDSAEPQPTIKPFVGLMAGSKEFDTEIEAAKERLKKLGGG
jgi:hypothetical protein